MGDAMARKKYEFRPDKTGPDLLGKLYLTKKQRLSLLKWLLFALVMLALLLIQDVILCRLDVFGATTDLVPCAIFLACVLLGVESGSVFALVTAALYQFSGSGPGYYVIAVIPALGILLTLVRQSYLRKGVGANILCTAIAFFLYEMCLLGIGLLNEQTVFFRSGTFLITTGLTLLAVPVLYPLFSALERIGGETWKE